MGIIKSVECHVANVIIPWLLLLVYKGELVPDIWAHRTDFWSTQLHSTGYIVLGESWFIYKKTMLLPITLLQTLNFAVI